CLQGYSIPFTF
nr:immunoglobulin light chain junction region [Macaca mulatta]MOY00548.1 immunoglobulin light chain junction region [Macaca mulatta]MOY02578.1 immunoglobulin light chain junction region [Macaca mulatta]MOY03410.1 immunoglobulin light chain junction region [Macaca mulatta]MOY04625.1 immunoglobulin light chain junction region [Macaca mulatta]